VRCWQARPHDQRLRAAMLIVKVLRQIVASRALIPASVCKSNSTRDNYVVSNRFPAGDLALWPSRR
jgi:hypothetical protein